MQTLNTIPSQNKIVDPQQSVEKIIDIRKHLNNFYENKSQIKKEEIFKNYMTTHDDKEVYTFNDRTNFAEEYKDYKQRVLEEIKNKNTSGARIETLSSDVKDNEDTLNLNVKDNSYNSANEDRIRKYNFKTDLIKMNQNNKKSQANKDIFKEENKGQFSINKNNLETSNFQVIKSEKDSKPLNNQNKRLQDLNMLNYYTNYINSLSDEVSNENNNCNYVVKSTERENDKKNEKDKEYFSQNKKQQISYIPTKVDYNFEKTENNINHNIIQLLPQSKINQASLDSQNEQEKIRFDINRKIKNQIYEKEYNRVNNNLDYVNERLKLNEVSKNYLMNKINEFKTVKNEDLTLDKNSTIRTERGGNSSSNLNTGRNRDSQNIGKSYILTIFN